MTQCKECGNPLNGNQIKWCSGACKQRGAWNKVNSQRNSYHTQTLRAMLRKLKYINYLGGCCKLCGYKKNIAALEFNHIDPSKKSFKLDSRKFSNCNELTLLEEVNKCELLCANCHREVHCIELELTNVQKILAENQRIVINPLILPLVTA